MIFNEILNIVLSDKEYFIKRARYGAAIVLLLSFAVVVPLVKGQASQTISSDNLIYLTNQERLKSNLPTLATNYLLNQAADNKAKAIIREQFFSHNLPQGGKFSNWVKEVNYQYTIVGENLATGFSTNEATMDAWMNSPAHRENILRSDYKDIGMAVVKGKLENKNTYVIVQYLGATNNVVISENLLLYKSGWSANLNGEC